VIREEPPAARGGTQDSPMIGSEGVQLLQGALLTALWVGLPVLLGVAVVGLLAGNLQGALGQNDPVAQTPPRLLAALGALLLFGAWMLALTAHYWVGMWSQAALLVVRRGQ
jgi:flagellar biosynthesis protein FliQ